MAAAAATAGLPAVVPASSGTGIAQFAGLRVQRIAFADVLIDEPFRQYATIYFEGPGSAQGSVSTNDPALVADMAKYMHERTLLTVKATQNPAGVEFKLDGEDITEEEEDRGEEFRNECKLEPSVLGSANGCTLMRYGNHLNGSHCAYRAAGCTITGDHALAAR